MELRLVSPLDKVHYGEAPQSFERVLSVLKGEIASFQAAWKLNAGERPAYFTLRAPLARVRRVMHVPVTFAAYPDADGDTRTAPGLYPDLLRDWDKPLRAFCDHWESAWLDVCFEEAGDFEVLVEALDGEGNVLASRAQKVHVVNATLPAQTLIHTKWMHLDGICRIYHLTPFTEEFYAVFEKWVRLAVSRGINMILTPIHTPPLDTYVGGERMTAQLVDVWEENGQYRFGTEKLEDWFRRLRAWGVEYFEMAHLFSQWGAKCAPKIVSADGRRLFGWDDASTGERYATFVPQYVRAVVRAIDRAGVRDRCYFHISDEPSVDAQENYMRCKALVEKEIEGFPIMDALSDFSFYQTGAVGLPIPAVNHIDPFIEAHVPNLWTYYCCGQYKAVTNMFIAMPSWRNRILGWQLFKYDIAGFLQWGFNFYNSQVSYYPIDPYSTTDSDGAFPAGDPFQVYPGADGAPEESIRIMVTLHSLCDLRALRLLEQLKGREAALEIVKDITFTEYPKNLDGILDMRDRVNAAIEASL